MAGPPRRAHAAGHRRYAVALRTPTPRRRPAASSGVRTGDKDSKAQLDTTHSAALFIAAPPAPVAVRQRDDDDEETGEKRIFFRTVPVFDFSMTDPLPGVDPVPLAPPVQPIEGDSHAHLIPPLHALAREIGYRVDVRELPQGGPAGWCDHERRQIVVARGPGNRQVRVLVHELAHALGLGYRQYGREQAEVLVDCVTYVVCSAVGLDVGGESIPYVAGWGEDGALDAIRACAETIDGIARRIEDALAERSDASPAEPADRFA